MKIKKTLNLNNGFLDAQSVQQTHFDILVKFPTTETCSLKVSEYFISTSSPTKLCRAQHVRKSGDLLTFTIGRGAEI